MMDAIAKPGRPLSVVIPSRNDANLRACIAAGAKNEPGATVVVVDDGLRNSWTGAIRGVKPFGFARNVNLGIGAAGEDDVVLLNDDALLLTPGGFRAMQRMAETDSGIGVVSAVSNAANHLLPWSLSFVCVFIPRRVIDVVGLLDERFTGVYGGEDDDYCYRVRRAGMRLAMCEECVVDHRSLPSTFRGLNGSLPIAGAQRVFREIHGFEMRTQ